MIEIGKQYPKDDLVDPSGFLRKARFLQSKFRSEVLNLPFDTYGNYLIKEDGEKGLNFYNGFGIFDSVKKYRKYNKPLYSNMLRSEHIPFNIFIPLEKNKIYCKSVFNEILNNSIKTIDRIEIEFAPKEKYLKDRTAFDSYIEYTHIDKTKGIIGIEVKYTEREYKLLKDSKESIDISEKKSKYFYYTEKCGIFKKGVEEKLISDKFRQIWRNHLLGESIIIENSDFKHFTSITLFPEKNSHFVETIQEYNEFLKENKNRFLGVTYEVFFEHLKKYSPDNEYLKWVNYLSSRYLISDDK